MIRCIPRLSLAYGVLPYTRNQDVVRVLTRGHHGLNYAVSVTDGWSNPHFLRGNRAGRRVAEHAAREFAPFFLRSREKNVTKRAQLAADKIEKTVLRMYPAHASCVAGVLVSTESSDVVFVVGDIRIYIWNDKYWKRLEGIDMHYLSLKKHPSDCSRFIGRGEIKDDPLYSASVDVVEVNKDATLLMASDGLEKVMTITQLNAFTKGLEDRSQENVLKSLFKEINDSKKQSDDIAVVLRGELSRSRRKGA